MGAFRAIILDFETTGLSPNCGDRTIEVGAVVVEDSAIVDRFQSLMNPGMRISSFIESYTGITNQMLSTAPPVAEVMKRLAGFIGRHPLVAHNASFDRRFLDAELSRIGHTRRQEIACTMLLARRIYPAAPCHTLEALVRYKNLQTTGVHHRALADAEMTAHLWLTLTRDLKRHYALRQLPFELLLQLSKLPKEKIASYLAQIATDLEFREHRT
jgi:DNA polymerase-3 subunit epsilon